ncbi:hypothetical protein MRX96_044892 [Rhipicephalus microplus]
MGPKFCPASTPDEFEKLALTCSEEAPTTLEESSDATELYESEMWHPGNHDDSPVYAPATYSGWRSPCLPTNS